MVRQPLAEYRLGLAVKLIPQGFIGEQLVDLARHLAGTIGGQYTVAVTEGTFARAHAGGYRRYTPD